MKVPLSWLRQYVDVNISSIRIGPSAHHGRGGGGRGPGDRRMERRVRRQRNQRAPSPRRRPAQALHRHHRPRTRVARRGGDGGGLRSAERGPRTERSASPVSAPTCTTPTARSHETLAAARIRGVESQGMICSELELGLGEDHTGIIVLPEDAPLGRDACPITWATPSLNLELTPNRLDCLSLLRVAHEVAALTGGTVTEPDIRYEEIRRSHPGDESASPSPIPISAIATLPRSSTAFASERHRNGCRTG